MSRQVGATVLLAGLLVGCFSTGSQRTYSIFASQATSWKPAQLDDGWTVASAQDVGLDTCLLDSMTAAIRRGEDYGNVHAVLIVKDDRLAYEQYFSGTDRRWRGDRLETVFLTFHPDTLHDTRSIGKSITSALVGIAVGSGAISSLDRPLVDYFPEHASLAIPEKRHITLRHALTMSAGFDWNEDDVPYTDPTNHSEQMEESADPAGFLLARPVATTPGSTWYYSSGLSTLLGLIVSRAVGKPLGAYAHEVLFEPLGVGEIEWGSANAWSGIPELRWESAEPWAQVVTPARSIWIRPRDLAKFGSLYLNSGRWNDQQILPAAWVEESTRWHIAVKDSVSEYGEHGYGYQWWHDRFHIPGGELEVHTAVGNGGQRIYVIPALDMLVIVLAGRYNDPDAFWMPEHLLVNHILPAVQRKRLRGITPCSMQR